MSISGRDYKIVDFGSPIASNTFFYVVECPSPELEFTNRVYVSHNDFNNFKSSQIYAEDPSVCVNKFGKEYVYMMSPHNDIRDGTIGLNYLQRGNCNCYIFNKAINRVMVKLFNTDIILSNLHLEVGSLIKDVDLSKLEFDKLSIEFNRIYNDQVFHEKDTITMNYNGLKLIIITMYMKGEGNIPSCFGKISPTTNLTWEKSKYKPMGTEKTQKYWITYTKDCFRLNMFHR